MVDQEPAGPVIESGLILAGPGNTIFDDIFDWIMNAIRTISGAVSSWSKWLYSAVSNFITQRINWLWGSMKNWLYWVRDQVWSRIDYIRTWVSSSISGITSTVSSYISSLFDSVRTWFNQTWSKLDSLWSYVGDLWRQIGQTISSAAAASYSQLSSQLSSNMTWLANTVTSRLDQVIDEVRAMIPEWIVSPGKWVPKFLDAVGAWLVEDVPGHSPRWTAPMEAVGVFFKTWLFDFPKWFAEDVPERVAYGLAESFKWVGDTLNPVVEEFNNSILSFARSLGPMSPSQAMTNFSSISKVGMAALGGLAGMTIAGELLHPLKRIGLGNLAAVIFDMTNYKLITGAFVGTLTYSLLQTPLRYYFNDIFRPMLLREGDFVELLSRKAFSDPETLQNTELIESMKALAPRGGSEFEAALVGWYGYPPEYIGLFRELANTRLGYFALAGVARSGFYDEAWFREALARTGYSRTAAAALLVMMRELYVQTKLQPVLPQVRRLFREGFFTQDKVTSTMEEAITAPDLAEVRLLAMNLERTYESKSTVLDISLRAFSRGVIGEAECRKNLAELDLTPDLISVHLDREKLGLIRRLSLSVPEAAVSFQFVEE